MRKKSRSKDKKTMKPRPVASLELEHVQGGALDPGARDEIVGIDGHQHNETLVEDR